MYQFSSSLSCLPDTCCLACNGEEALFSHIKKVHYHNVATFDYGGIRRWTIRNMETGNFHCPLPEDCRSKAKGGMAQQKALIQHINRSLKAGKSNGHICCKDKLICVTEKEKELETVFRMRETPRRDVTVPLSALLPKSSVITSKGESLTSKIPSADKKVRHIHQIRVRPLQDQSKDTT